MELTFPSGDEAMVCVFVTSQGDQRLMAVTTSRGENGPSMLMRKDNEDAPEVWVYPARDICDAAFLKSAEVSLALGYEFICHVMVQLPPIPEPEPPEVVTHRGPLRITYTNPAFSVVTRWADQILNVKYMHLPWGGVPS